MMFTQLLTGLLLGAAIGFVAWRARVLSNSGAFAAALVGMLIFGLGRLSWSMPLLVFFVSSSTLSRAFVRRKAAFSEKFSKGSRRDWGQVFANGGLGAGLVVAHFALPQQAWPWVAFAGALAAVNADTWATELGVLSTVPPRLITTGQPVERGTSGAVSWLGSLAALAGAALIGACAVLFPAVVGSAVRPFTLLVAASLGGLAGSLFDSFLGATWQAIYCCPVCEKETERHPLHACGTQTVPLRGLHWLNNDVVNFACSLFGALATVGVWCLL